MAQIEESNVPRQVGECAASEGGRAQRRAQRRQAHTPALMPAPMQPVRAIRRIVFEPPVEAEIGEPAVARGPRSGCQGRREHGRAARGGGACVELVHGHRGRGGHIVQDRVIAEVDELVGAEGERGRGGGEGARERRDAAPRGGRVEGGRGIGQEGTRIQLQRRHDGRFERLHGWQRESGVARIRRREGERNRRQQQRADLCAAALVVRLVIKSRRGRGTYELEHCVRHRRGRGRGEVCGRAEPHLKAEGEGRWHLSFSLRRVGRAAASAIRQRVLLHLHRRSHWDERRLNRGGGRRLETESARASEQHTAG